MALYQATAKLFVDNVLIQPGQKFASDGPPGKFWKPVDEAAESAVSARKPKAKASEPSMAPTPAPNAERMLVDIPANWRELNPEQRINLARQLGASVKGTKAADADKTIETELARRATV